MFSVESEKGCPEEGLGKNNKIYVKPGCFQWQKSNA